MKKDFTINVVVHVPHSDVQPFAKVELKMTFDSYFHACQQADLAVTSYYSSDELFHGKIVQAEVIRGGVAVYTANAVVT